MICNSCGKDYGSDSHKDNGNCPACWGKVLMSGNASRKSRIGRHEEIMVSKIISYQKAPKSLIVGSDGGSEIDK